ncbi:MAG: hypothetical protein K9L74_02670 [Candidatus Izimaplasma sp.]|nr:hypothetical protein [Candidatus Izimaplasma bacterium]
MKSIIPSKKRFIIPGVLFLAAVLGFLYITISQIILLTKDTITIPVEEEYVTTFDKSEEVVLMANYYEVDKYHFYEQSGNIFLRFIDNDEEHYLVIRFSGFTEKPHQYEITKLPNDVSAGGYHQLFSITFAEDDKYDVYTSVDASFTDLELVMRNTDKSKELKTLLFSTVIFGGITFGILQYTRQLRRIIKSREEKLKFGTLKKYKEQQLQK